MPTSRSRRLAKALPYAVLLAAAAYLYYLASNFNFTAPSGRIGPDVWPKAVAGLLICACAYQLIKIAFLEMTPADLGGMLQEIMQAAPAEGGETVDGGGPNALRLVAGILLTVGYVFAIERLGFFLCTFAYMAAFMLIGRYRRIGVIVATSLAGSLAFVFVFMKIVYVSLPLGEPPFASVSLFLLRLLGIK